MADQKSGKKAGSPDDVMAAGEMKAVLAVAKRGAPASCAIALTKDKQGVILLDKRLKPKQLLGDLKKKAAASGLQLDPGTMRFGHAVVDTDTDAGLLTFSVNREASGGMWPKLLEHVKKAGFSKLEIVVNAALESEPEDDAAPAPPQPAAPSAAPAPPPPATPAAPSPSSPAAAPPAAPAAVSGMPPGQDLAGLTRTLTELVKRMMPVIGADPTRAPALKALATEAQAGLKAGQPAQAATAIKALTDALAAPGTLPGTPSGTPTKDAATILKARTAWIATRQKIENDLGKLHGAFTQAFKGHPQGGDLGAAFKTRADTVLDALDETLAHKLDEVSHATDPAQHAKLVDDARRIIDAHKATIASDPTIAALDENPFAPMAIRKIMTASLSALSKALA